MDFNIVEYGAHVKALEHSVAGEWDVPETQREFVWKPPEVGTFAHSIWRSYPIGPLLLWRVRIDGGRQLPLWIADGRQRLTALGLLHGQVPLWFSRKPEDFRSYARQRFDVRFDIAGESGSQFVIPTTRGAMVIVTRL